MGHPVNYKTSKYYLKYMNEQKSKSKIKWLISKIISIKKTDHGTVVAIDLGTTNSCVSIFKDGRVEIIANDHGNRMTPSCVAFTPDGKRLIGDDAVNQLTSNPESEFISSWWFLSNNQIYIFRYCVWC